MVLDRVNDKLIEQSYCSPVQLVSKSFTIAPSCRINKLVGWRTIFDEMFNDTEWLEVHEMLREWNENFLGDFEQGCGTIKFVNQTKL